MVLGRLVHLGRHLGDAKVVVGVLERARDAPRHGARPLGVVVLGGDVAELFPAVEAAAAFAAPVKGLDFGVFDDGGEAVFPLKRVSMLLAVGVWWGFSR